MTVLKYGATLMLQILSVCLVLLQKKLVRFCGAKMLDYTYRLFYNLRILKVPDIVKLRIGIIIFKAYILL